ncbi:hypothetical protein HpMS191_14140 [Helicobacter pylori]
MALKTTAKKSLFANKKGVKITSSMTLKAQKQQKQSKKLLRMPFCLYGVSILFAAL